MFKIGDKVKINWDNFDYEEGTPKTIDRIKKIDISNNYLHYITDIDYNDPIFRYAINGYYFKQNELIKL